MRLWSWVAVAPFIVLAVSPLSPASSGLPNSIQGADGAEMMLVPAGPFSMGSEATHAKPRHRVHLDHFYVDAMEVTNAQYTSFTNATKRAEPLYGNLKKFNGSSQPVVGVSWFDADAYCKWAGKRLPTEAEWEKAARATTGRSYPWGDKWDVSRANGENKLGATTPVGSYPNGVSPYGIHDMAGNVSEWIADWYSEDFYQRSPKENPQGPESGTERVVRGGSWFNPPYTLRSWYRSNSTPETRSNLIGIRCVRSAQ